MASQQGIRGVEVFAGEKRGPSLMPLIVYLDESGDHSLDADDKDFPVFVLVMLVCDFSTYARQVVPEIFHLKLDYWGHESVILHSRDIRKCKGDFAFLLNPAERPRFYERINHIMTIHDYKLIPVAIKKKDHKERHGDEAENPYDFALKLALEGLLCLLEEVDQTEILIVAEARGKKEDDDLRSSLDHFIKNGSCRVGSDRIGRRKFQLRFVAKSMNVVGTQMADLAAYPIGRFVLNPSKPNPSYEIIAPKFYQADGWCDGLKIYPA